MQANTPHPSFDRWSQNPQATARVALACLDLTSLNDADTEADIARLCERAQGPFGPVAAVCVWPRLAAFARRQLPATIAVAAVANFPDGSSDVARAINDAHAIVQSGAQEVDLVLPYRLLQAGNTAGVSQLLSAVRKASEALRLKVILETGELQSEALIAQAAQLALDAGADFLKTSTGKTPVSATPAAAHLLLGAIAGNPHAAGRVGFKPSGGIRTVADAAVYIALCEDYLGANALTPSRFRIGASSVLTDIEAVLGQTGRASSSPDGAY
jgi:deoxyribose-phosphate aldolase